MTSVGCTNGTNVVAPWGKLGVSGALSVPNPGPRPLMICVPRGMDLWTMWTLMNACLIRTCARMDDVRIPSEDMIVGKSGSLLYC